MNKVQNNSFIIMTGHHAVLKPHNEFLDCFFLLKVMMNSSLETHELSFAQSSLDKTKKWKQSGNFFEVAVDNRAALKSRTIKFLLVNQLSNQSINALIVEAPMWEFTNLYWCGWMRVLLAGKPTYALSCGSVLHY